jgi:uroporphyrinogen decarboxylase
MTSRQRVLNTFAHEKTDRVPINYMANKEIDMRLKAHFGVTPGGKLDLVDHLHVDFRGMGAPYTGPRLHFGDPEKNVSAEPQWGQRTRWVKHAYGGYEENVEFPLLDADEETVANYPMPNPDHYDYEKALEWCKAERQGRNRAIFAGGAGLADVINVNGRLRGMEQALVDLYIDDPAGRLLTNRRLAIELQITERLLARCKGYIDFLWIGEDLGTQRGPMISLELYRKEIKPRHKPFVDLAKSHGLPVMLHCCGASSYAFEDFIALGIDAVDTLQPEAAGMAPEIIKKAFGGRLAFHGGVSTAGALAFGNVEETIAEVRHTLDVYTPGGGYMFSPAHMIQDNSPTENVVAMYREAFEYRL